MARGRALVVAAAQPPATGEITRWAVAVTAATAALVPPTCLHAAALLLTPERQHIANFRCQAYGHTCNT